MPFVLMEKRDALDLSIYMPLRHMRRHEKKNYLNTTSKILSLLDLMGVQYELVDDETVGSFYQELSDLISKEDKTPLDLYKLDMDRWPVPDDYTWISSSTDSKLLIPRIRDITAKLGGEIQAEEGRGGLNVGANPEGLLKRNVHFEIFVPSENAGQLHIEVMEAWLHIARDNIARPELVYGTNPHPDIKSNRALMIYNASPGMDLEVLNDAYYSWLCKQAK